MLSLSPRTKVYVALGPTDLRKSFDTLAALVSETLQQDPLSGHLFAFTNRGKNRIKLLLFDGSGLWVLAKRLERGTFAWPKSSAANPSVTITSTELSLLLSGIDLAATRERRWYRRPQAATS